MDIKVMLHFVFKYEPRKPLCINFGLVFFYKPMLFKTFNFERRLNGICFWVGHFYYERTFELS
jgi:hypothetical protein